VWSKIGHDPFVTQLLGGRALHVRGAYVATGVGVGGVGAGGVGVGVGGVRVGGVRGVGVGVGGVRGVGSAAATNTRVAVTVPSETVPTAPTRSPTHTSANVAAGVPGETNVDVVLTSTESVFVFFRVATVNPPAVPATPHEPAVFEPFTDATLPKAPIGCGGGPFLWCPAGNGAAPATPLQSPAITTPADRMAVA
jgi:hypothetical protein